MNASRYPSPRAVLLFAIILQYLSYACKKGGDPADEESASSPETQAVVTQAASTQSPAAVSIVYSGNGHTSGSPPVDANRYAYNSLISLASGETLQRNSDAFAGWCLDAVCSGEVYLAGSSYRIANADVIFYAKWSTAPYNLIFDGNGATSGTMSSISQKHGASNVLMLPINTFTRNGYSFAGWNTAADGSGTNYADQANYTFEVSNVTLYAQWQFTCKNLPGGTWVVVPGDQTYGTSSFCVMKYDASNVNSSPFSQTGTSAWVTISQNDAILKCASLGSGFHLVSNSEWMTIAANVAAQDTNWSGGAVGSGLLARGHSDNTPNTTCSADANDLNAYVESSCTGGTLVETSDSFEQRRTHYLSNGSVIWDLAGNYWQWVDYTNANEIPHSGGTSYVQYTSFTPTATTPLAHLTPQHSTHSFWDDSWNSAQSIGAYYPGIDSTGVGAMVRGGGTNILTNGGVFSARLSYGSNDATRTNVTFRCVYNR
jgi:uncharacterized repeat protein (TIGR02543 family)